MPSVGAAGFAVCTTFRTAGTLCLAITVAACQMPPTEVRAATVQRTQVVLPSDFLEANIGMEFLGMVTADFTTDGLPLSWNVHSHTSELIIHDEGSSASDTIVFVASQDGPVSILWVNNNSSPLEVTVALHLDDGAWLLSWQ